MKKFLGIIILFLILTGCAPTTSEFYSELNIDNKVISMPKSQRYVSKGLKKLFRSKGWKVIVLKSGSTVTTGEISDKVDIDSEFKSKASYEVSLRQNFSDICGWKNDKVSFDLSIINTKSGEEVFVATGDDCLKNIMRDLESQLVPFWN